MEKVRVLVLVTAFMPGGAETLIRNMLVEGFGEKFDITACSLCGPSGNFIEQSLSSRGVKVVYLNKNRKLYFDPFVVPRIYRLIKSFRPHIVHTHLNALMHALIPAVAALVPARVHTVHNTAHLEGRPPLRAATWAALRLFGFVPVGISEIIGRTVKDYYGVKEVPVINNSVITSEYDCPETSRAAFREKLGLADGRFAFVHVGRFYAQKNHELLVKAFAAALETRPDMTLLLVGDGPLRGGIESLVVRLGITGKVRFLGVRPDVPAVLCASDAFVFSSGWEGLPMTVAEAMAAGLPVVSTAVGGVPDMVRDGLNGILVKNGDQNGLADAMIKVASDEKLTRTMGVESARIARERFDISYAVEGHKRLYMTLLEKTGALEANRV